MTVTGKPQTKRQRIEFLFAQMETERQSFIAHWRDLNDYILPRRGRFFISDSNRGNRRTSNIIDSTPSFTAGTLSAGLMGGVTSPSRPWFRLSISDPALADLTSVKVWLDIVTERMRNVFLKSNLYQTLPITYKDMGTFATSAIFFEEDFEDVIRTFPIPIGSYMIANDAKLKVKVFARELRMTVRQVVEEFGMPDGPHRPIDWTNISQSVRSQWEAGQLEAWVNVAHFVGPNPDFDPNRIEAKYKKYESVYYELARDNTSDNRGFLRESGYDFFPVLVPRWEITGEDVFGTDCPGMTALGDVKQLHLGEKRLLQAIEKMVNPPTSAPSSLRSRSPSILPGAINYTDEREGQRGFRSVHDVDPRILELENKQNQVRGRIRTAYFHDLFLLTAASDRREVTAREIQERHEEKLIALGSVLERLNQDLLKPLIDLTFNIMLRQGMIPTPPPEIQGLGFEVEYISIMAQAQKLVGLGGIERFVAFVAQISEANPEAMDKLDTDQLIDEYAKIVGVPANIVLSDDDVAAIREERARAAAAKEAVDNALTVGRTAKNLSEAKIEGDNVLGQLEREAGEAAEAAA
jgi:hypothetical protein